MNEEDIKILEDYIELIKKGYCEDCNELCNIYGTPTYPAKKISEAIENLINRNKEIEEDYTSVYLSGFYDGENKWKSKIKEKIEELNKLITEAQKELGSASKEYTIYVYQKDILEELLEE